MSYRVDVFAPHPELIRAYGDVWLRVNCSGVAEERPPPRAMHGLMRRGTCPGTFALVLRIDGEEETVLERGTVAVLRSYMATEQEARDYHDELLALGSE